MHAPYAPPSSKVTHRNFHGAQQWRTCSHYIASDKNVTEALQQDTDNDATDAQVYTLSDSVRQKCHEALQQETDNDATDAQVYTSSDKGAVEAVQQEMLLIHVVALHAKN